MKIGILGAGSVGCWIGGRLAAAGEEVVLVGREALGAEIAVDGLTLTDFTGLRLPIPPNRIRFATQPSALADCEFVLVCVKAVDTETSGRSAAEHIAPSAVLVSFQNGVRNKERLLASVPNRRALAGMFSFNVLRRPGAHFHAGTSGPLAIEKAGGLETPLVEALRRAGLPTISHPRMDRVLWGKLILNLNNAVNAICGLPLRDQLSNREFRRLLAQVMNEGLAVLRSAGIRPARFGRMMPTLAPKVLPLPDALFFRLAGAMIKIDPEARSSMWEDLQRRRPTEIDHLNGEIVRLGLKTGHPTPLNARLTGLVKNAEVTRQGSPALTASQLAKLMGV